MDRRALLRRIILVLLLVFLLYLVTGCVLFGIRVSRGMRLAQESAPFVRKPPDAAHRILVAGDSTGVGTGSLDPALSIAGLIARDYPCIAIDNTADDGARIQDVVAQFDTVKSDEYLLVMVHAGGNDILRFTALDEVRRSAEEMLGKACLLSQNVIFVSTGNVGNAPAFFWPLNVVYAERTRRVRSIFREVSRRIGVYYVDLFQEREQDIFLRDKEKYFATDFLHPSAAGYALWYEEVRKQTPLDIILNCPRGRDPQED